MIPLSVPNLCGNEKKYLCECIDTTYVSSVGEFVERFEQMVARATGSACAVATSSGTTGLHVALTAAGVRSGDLVIIPSFTFIASANAVRHCGADAWLMDISDCDWCLDPMLVRKEIARECEVRSDGKLYHIKTGKRISALMPVYTLGNVPNMVEFREIANKYNIPLISDAACAIGATYEGENIGKLADLSVLSFNGNKTITCGGGGAVVGNNLELINHVRHLTTTARVWPDYDFDEVGFNYRMTNIQAAVGCAQMEKLDSFVESKRKSRMFYQTELEMKSKECGFTFFPTSNGSSCWFSGIVLPNGTTLEETKKICQELKDYEVEARPFWKLVHLQTPYKKCIKSNMSVSENLWQRILTLPCSTNISDDQLHKVASLIDLLV